jgi:hypothetical protein
LCFLQSLKTIIQLVVMMDIFNIIVVNQFVLERLYWIIRFAAETVNVQVLIIVHVLMDTPEIIVNIQYAMEKVLMIPVFAVVEGYAHHPIPVLV